MGKYKLMFKDKGEKRYYNFQPTVSSSSKPKYSKIDTVAKANNVKKELEKDFKNRTWKIKRK